MSVVVYVAGATACRVCDSNCRAALGLTALDQAMLARREHSAESQAHVVDAQDSVQFR